MVSMLASYYVWMRIGGLLGRPGIGNAGSQKTPRTFFILGVMPYICTGGVKLTHF